MPFITKKSTVNDYLTRAKFTAKGRVTPGAHFWDFMASLYEHTIVWSWVSKDCYETYYCLAMYLQMSIFAVNIYHFFIRKWCWKQCILNFRDWVHPSYKYVYKPL